MSEGRPHPQTILVADDNEDLLQLLTLYLERRGFRVVGAADGEQAVEAALRERPDLIMLDLNMPRLDGFEAARRIRQHAELEGVPIIANSAHGDHAIRFNLRQEELGRGFTFCLVKPLKLDELEEMLGRLLAGGPRPPAAPRGGDTA